MKKCPYCHADLQEKATFCLYCMTPLDEKTVIVPVKKRRRLLPYLAVAAAIILAVGVFASADPPGEPTLQTNLPSATTAPETNPQPTEPRSKEPRPTEPIPPEALLPAEDVFIIRKATVADFPEEYPHKQQGTADADYVIAGVKMQLETYYIPWQTSTGQMIVGITPDAFYGSGAKVVYACARLEYVCKDAFRGCALEDFYFAGYSGITIADGAFDSLGTLHSRYNAYQDSTEAYMPLRDFVSNGCHCKWEEWVPESAAAAPILFYPGQFEV